MANIDHMYDFTMKGRGSLGPAGCNARGVKATRSNSFRSVIEAVRRPKNIEQMPRDARAIVAIPRWSARLRAEGSMVIGLARDACQAIA
jgi:precorrin isomerase